MTEISQNIPIKMMLLSVNFFMSFGIMIICEIISCKPKIENNKPIIKDVKLNVLIDGKMYNFEPSGAMQTGWLNDNGTFYYLNKDGVMQKGKTYINGKTYDLASSGALEATVTKIDGYNKYMNLYNQAVKESEGPNKALEGAISQGEMNIDSYNEFKIFDNLYSKINTYLKGNLSNESLQVYNADTSSWMQNENAKATLLESSGGSIVPLMVNGQLGSDYQVKCKQLIENYMK